MRKMIFPLLFILAFAAFTLAMSAILYADVAGSPPPAAQISVIMYGAENNNRWQALELGIRQACRELDIEVPTTGISPSGDARQQAKLIEREVADGAQGLLIAPENSEEMAITLEDLFFELPIVFVKNGISGYEYVSVNEKDVASGLARQVLQHEGRIVLLADKLYQESIQARFEAFLQQLSVAGREVSIEPFDEFGGGTDDDILVALDNETLESLIDRYQDADHSLHLFGIGSSDKVVHALKQGAVEGIVFENEFAAGYIATMRLAAKMGLTKETVYADLQYLYVTRQTMFQPEMERLLFPIVAQ